MKIDVPDDCKSFQVKVTKRRGRNLEGLGDLVHYEKEAGGEWEETPFVPFFIPEMIYVRVYSLDMD